MWRILTSDRLRHDALSLQMNAERAGLAWGCPFASSAEFEAAVISSRRRAGAYGPNRTRRYARYAAWTSAAVGVIAVACLVL